MKFVTLEEVLAIHDLMLEVGGGREGIHDFTLLHSAVERPKIQFGGKYLYRTVWLAAGSMLQSLVKNHPFEDGNKRTAFFSVVRFLYRNGYELEATDKQVIGFMVKVDIEKLDVNYIASWLKRNSSKIKEGKLDTTSTP